MSTFRLYSTGALNIPDLVITQPHNKANTALKVEEIGRNIIVGGGCCFSSFLLSLSYVPLMSIERRTESHRFPDNADDELDIQTNSISWILALEDTEKTYEARNPPTHSHENPREIQKNTKEGSNSTTRGPPPVTPPHHSRCLGSCITALRSPTNLSDLYMQHHTRRDSADQEPNVGRIPDEHESRQKELWIEVRSDESRMREPGKENTDNAPSRALFVASHTT
ncbi:hypothetical protein PLEOSDRAFT_1108641 [Pleurotus ostreatus PC15]|uniref:Uncharacterized protein n=1 Tax=Pleurotus ostreatus (strain PC15) TaxID=1137138 RepID=A0A067N7R1_PLEO1|nr:hypothetical protein PLEOSDRAFT_1108641 [Pleurotus ostreatus PC15]